jgi:hypothetical protein
MPKLKGQKSEFLDTESNAVGIFIGSYNLIHSLKVQTRLTLSFSNGRIIVHPICSKFARAGASIHVHAIDAGSALIKTVSAIFMSHLKLNSKLI